MLFRSSSNDLHGLASERADLALAELGNSRDENRRGNITSVTTTLTTLSANDVNANLKTLLDVLGVADHVHCEDTGFVESVDDCLGGDTNGRDKELGSALNDDVDELVQLALGVIVAKGDNC